MISRQNSLKNFILLAMTAFLWTACQGSSESQMKSLPSGDDTTAKVSHRASAETGELELYDVCQGKWQSTGLPYREQPHYDKEKIVRSSQGIDRVYTIQGEKSKLFEVDIYHLDEHMKGGGPNVPKSLRGLWWMDGNPVPEVILSFGDAKYSEEERLLRNTFNGKNGYLFSSSILGRLWHEITNLLNGVIIVKFPESFNIEQPKAGDQMFVSPQLKGLGDLQTDWPTTYVNDSHWRRDTQDFCYNLRQIVDENGTKLPAYDYFVQQVQKQNRANGGRSPEVLLQARCIEEECKDQ